MTRLGRLLPTTFELPTNSNAGMITTAPINVSHSPPPSLHCAASYKPRRNFVPKLPKVLYTPLLTLAAYFLTLTLIQVLF